MSRDSNSFSKKKSSSKLTQAIAVHSELETGLTMIAGPYSELLLFVYALMAKALAQAWAHLPVPMPTCDSIVCLHSGTSRQIEQLHDAHGKLGLLAPDFKKCKFAKRVTSSVLDWTHLAAASIIRQSPLLKSGSCILLLQPVGAEPDFEGLFQLRRIAEEKGAHIILLCPGVADEFKYSCVANEFFVVTPSDPNPGFDEAFVLSCPELASSLNPASGKVLCCVRLGDEGLDTEVTPYVADDLKTRLMAILKADSWNMEKIGKAVGLDKSNVSRKTRFISATVPDGWNRAVLAQWFEACGLDPIEVECAGGDESDDEPSSWDDGDNGDDLDDLDCKKSVAQYGRNMRNARNDDTARNVKKKQR